ncbi:MAG: HNH endonuclease [Variovorax sp.]
MHQHCEASDHHPCTRGTMAETDIAMKCCTRCGINKPLVDFPKSKGYKGGVNSRCKRCRVEQSAEAMKKRPEHYSAWREKWLAERPGYVDAVRRAWINANPEREKQRQVDWYAANQDKVRARRLNYWARKKSAPGSHSAADVLDLLNLQRGKCACCRCSIEERYDVDHVTALAAGGSNDRSNLQLLCPTCNKKKNAKDPIAFMQENGFLL